MMKKMIQHNDKHYLPEKSLQRLLLHLDTLKTKPNFVQTRDSLLNYMMGSAEFIEI